MNMLLIILLIALILGTGMAINSWLNQLRQEEQQRKREQLEPPQKRRRRKAVR